MSEEETDAADTSLSCCCASCGIAEIDDVKLVPCDGCDLVRYCSDDCQDNHKQEHARKCKRRAAELREELLFKQPDRSSYGDCPICCLPMPIDVLKTTLFECCSKTICKGCEYANDKREIEMRLPQSCPFCRQALPETDEEGEKLRMKRIEANDPVALRQQGHYLRYLKEDYIRAFEYFTMAVTLGDVEAHYKLAVMYREGHGVEKDVGKKIYHYEQAAISGHPRARYNLGFYEWNNNENAQRAVKHWIIAATLGEGDSLKALMKAFEEGFIEKKVLAAALRSQKAAVDATKSPQRKAAAPRNP